MNNWAVRISTYAEDDTDIGRIVETLVASGAVKLLEAKRLDSEAVQYTFDVLAPAYLQVEHARDWAGRVAAEMREAHAGFDAKAVGEAE